MLDNIMCLISPKDRLAALNKGATQEEIRQAEISLGVEFPDQLKRLYMEANGESGSLLSSEHNLNQLFYSFEFLNLSTVSNDHNMHLEAYSDYLDELFCYPEGYIKNTFFNSKWIPFAKAGSAIYIAIDMDPGEKGVVGQVIIYGADALPVYFVLSPSLNAFINSLAAYLNRLLPREYSVDEDYLNAAHAFYEGEEWRSYSEEEFKRLLNDGNLPFWHS